MSSTDGRHVPGTRREPTDNAKKGLAEMTTSAASQRETVGNGKARLHFSLDYGTKTATMAVRLVDSADGTSSHDILDIHFSERTIFAPQVVAYKDGQLHWGDVSICTAILLRTLADLVLGRGACSWRRIDSARRRDRAPEAET